VGLLPSPNGYSPCFAPLPPDAPVDSWAPLQRRNLVLGRMHEEGFIDQDSLRDALRRPLNIDPSACRESSRESYPYFSDYVRGELEGRRFGLNLDPQRGGGNYAVVSTVDPRLQQLAQREVGRFLEKEARPMGLNQAALISLDVRSGAILAYVGGGDYRKSSFDRVQALRQPGSTFKLFTFLAALGKDIEPAGGPQQLLQGAGGVAVAQGGGGSLEGGSQLDPVAMAQADRADPLVTPEDPIGGVEILQPVVAVAAALPFHEGMHPADAGRPAGELAVRIAADPHPLLAEGQAARAALAFPKFQQGLAVGEPPPGLRQGAAPVWPGSWFH